MATSKNARQIVAGGVAGCVSKTCIAPMDRVKILLQAQHPYYKQYGVFAALRQIIKREGILSLWKGNSMMMLRIFPYASIQFFAFERFKLFYTKRLGKRPFNSLLSGSSAGVTAVLATYPLDMVRSRLAFQITGEHRYHGIAHAVRTIYATEGIRGFYRGIAPTVLGMVPYAGLSFYTFEGLKYTGIELFPELLAKQDPYNDNVLVLRHWAAMMIGGFAGAIGQTISFPCDVARRRMQLSGVLPNPEQYRSIWSTWMAVYKADGIKRGLFRGLSINYIRVVPQQAIAFTVYEFMRAVLRLNKPNVKQDKANT